MKKQSHKVNHKPAKKMLCLLFVFILLLTSFTACKTATPSDEELIAARITTFYTAYNDGDLNTVLECLENEVRLEYQAMYNLLGGAVGGLAGLTVNMADLFSLADTYMDLEIKSVSIHSDKTATAETVMTLDKEAETIYFDMVFENGDWFIKDFTSKKTETEYNEQTQASENEIVLTKATNFVEGFAVVNYKENNEKYSGIINTDGEIIFSDTQKGSYLSIGGGAILRFIRDEETDKDVPAYILDSNGNIVATFDEKLEYIAHGDGKVLLYKTKDTITEVERLYGIIDASGQWVQPFTNLGGDPARAEDCKYLGDGIFAISPDGAYGFDDFVFWNSISGFMFFVSRVEQLNTFTNGQTLIKCEYSKIYTPYQVGDENDDTKGIKIEEDYIILNTDGTYKNYDMTDKNNPKYSNGYLRYYKFDDDNTYIETLFTPVPSTITYGMYSHNKVVRVSFEEDYGLVLIWGANNKLYFTLIDKTGKQLFEPIETSHPYTKTSEIKFSDNRIIFKNTDNKYCIADTTGQVTVTEYSSIGEFSNGIAVASIKNDTGTTWHYINTDNEQILKTLKKR